jgi:uncharacterized protein YjiS (DUF1127 family)
MDAHSNAISTTGPRSDAPMRYESLLSSAQRVVAQWLQRARDRHELANLSVWQRRDMGLTLDAIESEVRKPFWRA